jgi:hypothetical protein
MTPEPEFAYETSDGRKVDGTIDTLRRVVLALLFGSFDMLQAAAACDMLDEETTDASRTRALETVMSASEATLDTHGNRHVAHGPTPPTRSTLMRMTCPGGGLSIGGNLTSGPRST